MWCRGTPGRNEVPSANVESTQFAKTKRKKEKEKEYSMEFSAVIVEKLQLYGVGRRGLDDHLFLNDKTPPRLGVYDLDEEYLYHDIIQTTCTIPGCKFTAESLLEFENHYNASHRYTCGQCKRVQPSPHLLDLHIQETHDSFFAVMAERKPSYCCYIEECKSKFMNPDDRLKHCVEEHKLPKDFRFEQKSRKKSKSKPNKNTDRSDDSSKSMETDGKVPEKKIIFSNSKQKMFTNYYTGRKFTSTDKGRRTRDVDMDEVVSDLKESLP